MWCGRVRRLFELRLIAAIQRTSSCPGLWTEIQRFIFPGDGPQFLPGAGESLVSPMKCEYYASATGKQADRADLAEGLRGAIPTKRLFWYAACTITRTKGSEGEVLTRHSALEGDGRSAVYAITRRFLRAPSVAGAILERKAKLPPLLEGSSAVSVASQSLST